MLMYDAYQAHVETKQFEMYLLIQNCIQNECKNGIREILLQKLDQSYKVGEDLMEVLNMMNN